MVQRIAPYEFSGGYSNIRGRQKTRRECPKGILLLPLQDSYNSIPNMLTLGLGQLFYTLLCFINAIAVLSEERFLARSKLKR